MICKCEWSLKLFKPSTGPRQPRCWGLLSWKKVVLVVVLASTMLLLTLLLVHILRHTPKAHAAAASPYALQGTFGSPDDWQKYVRSPAKSTVSPVRIVSNYTQGNVTNPEGLLTGQSSTILTRNDPASINTTDVIPTIVVDFGQNVVGFVSIQFGGASNSTAGFPGIRLAFSETLEFLTNVSDFSRSYNVRLPIPMSILIKTRG